jgi:hypothetical protein
MRGRDSRRRFRGLPLGQRHLAFELGGERHRAGAATGAAHGDENVLLLLLVEVCAIEQLSGLLFEQRVQRECAIRNLILRRGLRSGVSLPCRWSAPDLSGPVFALRHSCLQRLANGHSGCRPICSMIFPQASSCARTAAAVSSRVPAPGHERSLQPSEPAVAARSAADGGARFFCPRIRAHDTLATYRVTASSGFRLLSTGRRLRLVSRRMLRGDVVATSQETRVLHGTRG